LDKTIIGLLGGASALALLGGAPASAASSPDEANVLRPARSFAELLDPIPNAASVLRIEDERTAADAPADEKPLVVAQYHHHHHHHPHHHYHHHHHHHHHHYHHHYWWHGHYY
jgi:G3E family GTPase